MFDIFDFPSIQDWTIAATQRVVTISLTFQTLFIMIALIYNVSVSVVKSRGKTPIDLNKLSKLIVLFFVLSLYIPLTSTVVKIFEIMHAQTHIAVVAGFNENKTALLDNVFMSDIEDEVANIQEELDNVNNEVKSSSDMIEEESSFFGINLKSSKYSIGSKVITTFGILQQAFKYIITMLNTILVQLFYILGPFSILFSSLPSMEGKFNSWLSTFITFLFVPIVFEVLDLTILGVISAYSLDTSIFLNTFVVNILLAIVYILPFWIARKLLGNADTGRFISASMQLATIAVGSIKKTSSSSSEGTNDSFSTASSSSNDGMSTK